MIQQLLNMNNNNKKLDVILMNPPYNNGLHESFLNKVLDIAKECVSIQPDSYLYKGKNGNTKIKNKLSQLYTNIENIDANKYFDGGFQNRIAILHTSENLQKTIIINGNVIRDLNNISMHFQNKLLMEFDKIIKPLMHNNCGEKWKGTLGSHYKDRVEYNENEKSWCVKCALLRGNISTKTKDGKDKNFYTCITNNEKLIESQFIGQYKDLIKIKDKHDKLKLQYYFAFNTEDEARNFINYIKTDFVRTCLYLKKKDMNVTWNYIPWFDFSDNVFSKSPKEIDDYLFKKYNISDEIRKHIEEILPDYYNIR